MKKIRETLLTLYCSIVITSILSSSLHAQYNSQDNRNNDGYLDNEKKDEGHLYQGEYGEYETYYIGENTPQKEENKDKAEVLPPKEENKAKTEVTPKKEEKKDIAEVPPKKEENKAKAEVTPKKEENKDKAEDLPQDEENEDNTEVHSKNGKNKDKAEAHSKNGKNKKTKDVLHYKEESFANCPQGLVEQCLKEEQADLDELKDRLQGLEDDIDSLHGELEDLAQAPSEESLAMSNLLIKGTLFVTYDMLRHHNGTFVTGWDPLFLWRYGDKILFEAELIVDLDEIGTDITCAFACLDYIYNDYFTFRVGYFELPLGIVSEKYSQEWITKFPYVALPYFPDDNVLIPAADLGIEVRGAIPLNFLKAPDGIPAVFTYDLWLAQGPNESDGQIQFNTNFRDNNHNLAIGWRFAFRPRPYREIGISGMSAQWNNDSLSPPVTSKRALYYDAFVIDLNWHFNDYCRLTGEYIWTRYDNENLDDYMVSYNSFSDSIRTSKVIDTGFWIEFSTLLGFLECKSFENWEIATRYAEVKRQSNHTHKYQASIGINYYVTNKLIIKNCYDFNWGRQNREDRYTIQVAYGF